MSVNKFPAEQSPAPVSATGFTGFPAKPGYESIAAYVPSASAAPSFTASVEIQPGVYKIANSNGDFIVRVNGEDYSGTETFAALDTPATEIEFIQGQDSWPQQVIQPGIWTTRATGSTSNFQCATAGGGVYLAGGTSGGLVRSTDGITWSTVTSGTANAIRAMSNGNGLYFFMADGPVLRTSTDGITWTTRTSGAGASAPRYAGYGNGVYLASWSDSVLRRSTDGITWTTSISGADNIVIDYAEDGLYIIGGNSGFFRTSTDAITWTARTTNLSPTAGVTNVVGRDFGKGYVANAGTQFSRSTDGITWSASFTGLNTTTGSINFHNNLMLGCTGDTAVFSTDGLTWTAQAVGGGGLSLQGAAGEGETVYVVGTSGALRTNSVVSIPEVFTYWERAGTSAAAQ